MPRVMFCVSRHEDDCDVGEDERERGGRGENAFLGSKKMPVGSWKLVKTFSFRCCRVASSTARAASFSSSGRNDL